MPPRLIRHRDLVRTPGRNGGGTTAEVAAAPNGAGIEAFDWRISMADVGADGPFSTFPGIDRTLVLIEGQGIELTVNQTTHRLDAASPLFCFTGEALTTARLTAGPIRDLNVMTRRGRFAHEVRVMAEGTADLSSSPASVIAFAALSGRVRIVVDDEPHALERLDVLITDENPSRVAVDQPALLISLWEGGSPPGR